MSTVDEEARRSATHVARDEDFRLLADNMPVLCWIADAEGYIFWYNRRWYEFTGATPEEMAGWGWQSVHDPAMLPSVLERWTSSIATGEPFEMVFPLRNAAGEYHPFLTRVQPYRDETGKIIRWFGKNADISAQRAAEDALESLNHELEARVVERTADLQAALSSLQREITERQVAEAQLRQIQKMEAVGQLTGGIAHDFNNMLAIILGCIGMAKKRLRADPDRAAELLANAEEGANRAAALTSRLLAFSRQQPLEPRVLETNKVVAGMSELLRRTIGERVRIETVLAAGLWRTHADPAQLESAVVNICVNSRDAMPDGGTITIETGNSDFDEAYAAQDEDITPGQYVLVSVTDTGVGMAPEVVERVFEPFFTTKGVGRGTGLGLSQVYGFVKQSGGHVKLHSKPGQGTTVKVYLPRYIGAAASAKVDRAGALPAPRGRAAEVVLVVEDESQVRHTTVDMLRDLGYTVVPAADGKQALEQLELRPLITLLLTDVVMPEMDGRKLADEARRRRPSLPILFTTGYARNAVVHTDAFDVGVSLLPKPFTLEQLSRKVRTVIDGAKTRKQPTPPVEAPTRPTGSTEGGLGN